MAIPRKGLIDSETSMIKYDPNIHNRKSIRLKGYDYSQSGFYFVTICAQNRDYLFGEISNGSMILNDAGKMIKKWYGELENKFPNIKCDEMVIMPNHFHCIIHNVGADLRVCPNVCPNTTINAVSDEHTNSGERTNSGEHIGSPLHRVVQWFKTMTTNEYIRHVKSNCWKRFAGKLWQRNYWEHIIRNEESYNKISEYIKTNPNNWINDTLRKSMDDL